MSMRRISPNDASAMLRARQRLRIIPDTFSCSTTTVPWLRARRVVSLCMASQTYVGDSGVNTVDSATALLASLTPYFPAAERSLRPSEDTEVLPERSRIAFELCNHARASCDRQVPYSDINADHRRPTVCGRNRALDFYGEGNEPTLRSSRDGSRKDAGSSLLNTTSELPSGLVGSDLAEPGKGDVMPVRLHPDCAGGEPTGVPRSTPFLELRKSDSRALASSAGTVPIVLECSR
jgi:hypothetical protein